MKNFGEIEELQLKRDEQNKLRGFGFVTWPTGNRQNNNADDDGTGYDERNGGNGPDSKNECSTCATESTRVPTPPSPIALPV